MSPSVRDYLLHMLQETNYLLSAADGVDEEAFLHDETLKRAFVRSLEIIGEAAKQVPADVRQRHAQIEWRAITGMRDRLIHGYFGVDYEIVWDAVQRRILGLQREIMELLAGETL